MTNQTPAPQARPRRIDPADLIGRYAIINAPLGGPPFTTIRIERASRDGHGSLIVHERRVSIDANGALTHEGDYIRALGGRFWGVTGNPLTARARCQRANDRHARMLEMSAGLQGPEFTALRDREEAAIERILEGAMA